MPRIKARDYDRRADRHFDVVFRKRNAGGWLVERRDTGHSLGWLYQDRETGQWSARCGAAPFVPTGGDILDRLRAEDRVEGYLCRRIGPASYGQVAVGATRAEAVEGLLVHLLRARALAVEAPDVAATQAAIAEHEAQAADYREAAESPHMREDGRPMMRRAAAQEDEDAAALRAQLAGAEVPA